MKKFIVNLAILISTSYFLVSQANLPTLTKNDHTVLDTLYSRYSIKPTFYKTHADHLIDGYINLLANRIQLFEYILQTGTYWKYLEGKNKEDCKNAALNSIVLIICGLFIGYQAYAELLFGKFNTIEIPYDLFKKISSLRYTIAQKRYFKKFNVEKIHIKDYSLLPHYDYKGQKTIAKLSSFQKEKLKYTALDYAITNHKKQFFRNLLVPLFFLSFGILCGFCSLYAIFSYSEVIAKKLEQDKELYVVFKEEQEYRLSLNLKSL